MGEDRRDGGQGQPEGDYDAEATRRVARRGRESDPRRADAQRDRSASDPVADADATAETVDGGPPLPTPLEGPPDVGPDPPPRHARYRHRAVIGRGGQGVVHRVFDVELRREVALKTLRRAEVSPATVERFLREAAATAALDHPNIIPIHDVGRLEDERPFYTMRLIGGRSLKAVLAGLRRGEGLEEYSTVRLVQILQQVCQALQLAHENGVVHRDIKPANLMLGVHGEVLVVDWGIARQLSGDGISSGTIRGTVAYMSPEHARGEMLDGRADVFSLGIVLYEALTFRRPWEGESDADLTAAILRDPPRPPHEVSVRDVPPELADLVMRALTKRKVERIQTAAELHDGLQAWLEGQRDLARRREAAEALREEGARALSRHGRAVEDVRRLTDEIARLEKVHAPWQPIAEKRPLLDARRALEEAETASQHEFLETVNKLTDALAHVPDHREVRGQLADMFWERLVGAERVQDRALTETYLALVRRFHDGRYARELDGSGSVRVKVWPAHADWTLHPQVERDLVLVDGPPVVAGRGDVLLPSLAMGSYVLVARAEGCEPARYPIAIFRNTDWDGELRLLAAGSIPDGFVYIPGTKAWLGGDPLATNSWPLHEVWVDSFLMKRHPVTFGEYCEFLDGLGEAEAREHVPRVETLGELCEPVEGRWRGTLHRVWSADTRRRFEGQEPRLPVVGLSHGDAAAFATATHARLPTSAEWEHSARGCDLRVYPWGRRFDATLARLRDTTSVAPDLWPVGSVATDQGVHGTADLAGTVQEWTGTTFDEERRLVESRGGYWSGSAQPARAAWRGAATVSTRTVHLGARTAITVGRAAGT